MISVLLLQISIFILLILCARQDYKTRTVSNSLILWIAVLSIPVIIIPILVNHTINFLSLSVSILLCLLFLILFFLSDRIKKINPKLFTNTIGGADVKVFIPLLLSMSVNEIFIFFLLFTVPNIYYLIRFCKGIPMFIPILFGYFGILLLSFLPLVIKIVFNGS